MTDLPIARKHIKVREKEENERKLKRAVQRMNCESLGLAVGPKRGSGEMRHSTAQFQAGRGTDSWKPYKKMR